MNKYDRIAKQNAKYLDEFRGCLIGGAAGDALGYPVEFVQNIYIRHQYGEEGIRNYDLSPNGKACISDDTQMTLFTAMGLMQGYRWAVHRGDAVMVPDSYVWKHVYHAYQIWYRLQKGMDKPPADATSYDWLIETPEMAESRAPGNTCMSVLGEGKLGMVHRPVNDSKGCGGIMRVAPVGLFFNRPMPGRDRTDWVMEQAATVAALTHGHELGWLPAAMLALIVNCLTYGAYTVDEAVSVASGHLEYHYANCRYTRDLIAMIDKARKLARNQESDYDNISSLGGGWVAEETLAIAVYCSIRYEDDFSAAICAAVNHDGDSDSTGAVTGNIMGALWGYERIPDQWKQNLECSDVILRVADELCHLNELSLY